MNNWRDSIKSVIKQGKQQIQNGVDLGSAETKVITKPEAIWICLVKEFTSSKGP